MPHTSRRRFVQAAATLAAPLIVPARVFGQTAPSNRIHMGFIGTGGQGNQHISGGPWTVAGGFMGRTDAQILAICDVEKARLDSTRNRINQGYAEKFNQPGYSACDAYHDFRELLARPDIDAVLIATPDHWHALVSIAAIKAGKDVYCEKPISLTIREVQEMVRVTRSYGRILQAGTQQRSSPAFRYGCELVRNGRIGELKHVYVNVGGPSTEFDAPPDPVPAGMDWNFWLGQAPWRPYSARIHRGWMAHRDYSGGEMTNWGAHHYDIAQWGIGADDTGPVHVRLPDGKDFKQLTWIYRNGVQIHHGGHPNSGVTFVGTEGEVQVDRWFCKSKPASIATVPIRPTEINLPHSHNHHDNFIASIRSRRRPIADIAISARSISICHMGNIAYWLNRNLDWNPEKWEFVGDDVPNRWLDRQKREPWNL